MEKINKIRFDDPNQGKLKAARGERAINIRGSDWFWTSNGFEVNIRSPKNKKIKISSHILLGGDPNQPMWDHALITPFDIRKYIDENLGYLA